MLFSHSVALLEYVGNIVASKHNDCQSYCDAYGADCTN